MGELVELDKYRTEKIIEREAENLKQSRQMIVHQRMAMQHLKKCVVSLPVHMLVELDEFIAEVIIAQQEG
jgi:hypothetical protein